jgi:hypothetical protein
VIFPEPGPASAAAEINVVRRRRGNVRIPSFTATGIPDQGVAVRWYVPIKVPSAST